MLKHTCMMTMFKKGLALVWVSVWVCLQSFASKLILKLIVNNTKYMYMRTINTIQLHCIFFLYKLLCLLFILVAYNSIYLPALYLLQIIKLCKHTYATARRTHLYQRYKTIELDAKTGISEICKLHLSI